MPTVVLIGTLDTKGSEYAFLRDRLAAAGVGVVMVDTGVLGLPQTAADVTADEVARAAGADLASLRAGNDRGAAVTAMATGATAVLLRLYGEGRCDGALALGGSGGTSIAAEAFRALPVGVPKLIVSTIAASDTRSIVGERDVTLMPSVVDVAGVNTFSARIFTNAAAAMAGMVTAEPPRLGEVRPLVAASMFGVTTACVTAARGELEERGYEVLTFHMTGTGGSSMEHLVEEGYLRGVLDVTTTELADELVGGVFSAGDQRLTAAAAKGLPQVVSVGALDMVNFGPAETVPEVFHGRNLYVHNSQVTLMRTTPEECAELGRRLAARVSTTTGPAAVFLPLAGVSALSTEGAPFHDPAADAALFDAVRDQLDTDHVELVEMDTHVNDPAFAQAMVTKLHTYVSADEETRR